MKVVLRDTSTQRYLTKDGSWSESEEKAEHFKTPLEAMNFCHLHHLSHTAIVVENNGMIYEMPLRCEE